LLLFYKKEALPYYPHQDRTARPIRDHRYLTTNGIKRP
jgi:hypothetical protein